MTNLINYSSINSIPEIWPITAEKFPQTLALHNPHSQPKVKLTYSQLWQQIRQFAAGLQGLGLSPQAKIALFADNSPRWFIADQGIMTAGAANAVRSSTAEKQELLYILQDSNSSSLVIQDRATLEKLQPELDSLPLDLIIFLSDEEPPVIEGTTKILNFSQLMAAGADGQLQPVSQQKKDLATLIYTSGTTGKPKGAMLSHGNLLHQVTTLATIVEPERGDRALSILPSWHVYERTVEYLLLSQGATQIYTNLRSFKQDLQQFKPQYMVGVPRLWESLYEAVQKQFRSQPANKQKLINFCFNLSNKYITAKRIAEELSLENLDASSTKRFQAKLKAILLSPLHFLGEKLVYKKVRQATGDKVKLLISGGGSLARHLDTFYEIVGIPILVGYGLTETSPVATLRRPERNLRGSAGIPVPEVEIRIVHPETGVTLAPGQRGLVLIRGPLVMQGYYGKPEATAKAIDSEGWFNSGDLGFLTAAGDLVLTGRAKDTIVLTNGENIEPQPIEDACLRSTYIDQIMLVGQDQRGLGALIVPNLEAIALRASLFTDFSEALNVSRASKFSSNDTRAKRLSSSSHQEQNLDRDDLKSKAVQDLFRAELNRLVRNRPGYRPDDRITTFEFILEPFSIADGTMTQTMKIKRPLVTEKYSDVINNMFS